MSDRGAAIELIAIAWDETDMTQTEFAELLREEADLYEEAPEEARHPQRVVADSSNTDVVDVEDDDGGSTTLEELRDTSASE